MNIQSLWQLVLARPQLSQYDRELRPWAGERVEAAALDDSPTGSSTVELNNLRCAVQLANR